MKFTAGLAQMGPTLGDLEANRKRVLAVARKALRRGVELLLFPELALTGFFLKDVVPSVAQTRWGALVEELKALSRDMALVVGFVEESRAHIFYNAAAYFEEGRLVHCHRKVYLPTYGIFDEQRYLGRGRAVRAFDTRFGRAAILICEDAWHPSLAYLASQDGADLLFIPSASPGRGVRRGRGRLGIQESWRAINRCYAQTLSQFVFFANRVGYEDGINFWGG
ncbi:MAG: nitrilase-related carbon-nitrogen hydrolase, partial [Nitrospinota bacterium]